MTSAYPLSWPTGVPRVVNREGGQFRTSLAGALKNVQDSLRQFASDSGKKIADVVLSSNCCLGVDKPKDPGVAAWFVWDGQSYCIAVDRYATPAANLQAIHHIIEARRVELRHGSLAMVRAAFVGLLALPHVASERWQDVLGFISGAAPTAEQIEYRYRSLAKQRHPDHGGTAEAFAELTTARKQALAQVGGA